MRQRKSARIFLLDHNDKVLLFRFCIKEQNGKMRTFWATPGGEIIDEETASQAAKRELFEETGLIIDETFFGEPVYNSQSQFRTSDGEIVQAQEKFFVIKLAAGFTLTDNNWTSEERAVIVENKWWSIYELKMKTSREIIYPENIVELLEKIINSPKKTTLKSQRLD